MTKVKLIDSTAILCDTVEIQNGTLVIETNTNQTAEELRNLCSDKGNLAVITLQTEAGNTLGYKYGFVCYAGITLLEDGRKRIELIQEKDIIEQRITHAETQAFQAVINSNQAVKQSETADNTALQAKEQASLADNKIEQVQANVDQAILELTLALAAAPEEGGISHV